jgi:tetratricopeptide (TPR) repeat protein
MAEPFANGKQWPVANTIYRRAIEFSPAEDYYYLFLGRGSLEEAKAIEDPIQQEEAFKTAESDLLSAQDINPLNPDHTANLARLYSWWALQAPDNPSKIERGTTSDQYYERVTILSPNNARLWDEWAILHLNILDNSERALELLNHSLSIDPKYDWTYALLGDYYGKSSQDADNDVERVTSIEKAVQNYHQAIVHSPTSVNYYFALAGAYQSLDDIPMVIATLEDSLEYAGVNDSWKIEDNLTHYYLQLNDMPNALLHAQKALMGAPETEKERIRSIINQITTSP